MEQMRVEEVGEARRRNGRDGRSLVVERGNEEHTLEGEMVFLSLGNSGMWCLQKVRKSFDRSAGTWGLEERGS